MSRVRRADRARTAARRSAERRRRRSCATSSRRRSPRRRRQVAFQARPPSAMWRRGCARLDVARPAAARSPRCASRLRRGTAPAHDAAPVAAFVHRAFWRAAATTAAPSRTSGRCCAELERGSAPTGVRYVGVGPRRISARAGGGIRGLPAAGARSSRSSASRRRARCAESRSVWRDGTRTCRALCAQRGCGRRAISRRAIAGRSSARSSPASPGCSGPGRRARWTKRPPRSTRSRPRVAVTYAEAGGWGRALDARGRRRGIPSAGLQHGFIYRHWLNYLHEAGRDAPTRRPDDRGFPVPDADAALRRARGAPPARRADGFPPDALSRHGQPAARRAVASRRRLATATTSQRMRRDVGADRGRIVLIATKEREARAVLPALIEAAAAIPDVRLVIKPHPGRDAGRLRRRRRGTARGVRVHRRADSRSRRCWPRARRGRHGQLHGRARCGRPRRAGACHRPAEQPVAVRRGGGDRAAPDARGRDPAPSSRSILYDQEFRQQLANGRGSFLGRRFEAMRPDAAARPARRPRRDRQGWRKDQ